MSSNESTAYDAAMHQYEKQYDGLKAELQTLGFIGQGSVSTRPHNVWEARLSLPQRPGGASRPVPLLDAQGARKDRRLEAHRRRSRPVAGEWIENNRELERLVKEMRRISSRVLALITGRQAP